MAHRSNFLPKLAGQDAFSLALLHIFDHRLQHPNTYKLQFCAALAATADTAGADLPRLQVDTSLSQPPQGLASIPPPSQKRFQAGESIETWRRIAYIPTSPSSRVGVPTAVFCTIPQSRYKESSTGTRCSHDDLGSAPCKKMSPWVLQSRDGRSESPRRIRLLLYVDDVSCYRFPNRPRFRSQVLSAREIL